MWPQKWNASASPGLTSAPTPPAPATNASRRDVRARNPRRDVDDARSSAIDATSGIREGALCGCEDALELAVAVERPFRADVPVTVERDSVRTAWNTELAPDVGVARFVELGERQERIAAKRREHRLQGLAQTTAVRGEHR